MANKWLKLKQSNNLKMLNVIDNAMLKQKLDTNLKSYIATPWDPNKNKLIQPEKYYDILKSKGYNLNEVCSKQIKSDDKGIVCQSHGGNLYEHSRWSALQVIQWIEDKDEITDGLKNVNDIGTAIVCAYFHDIGKGGDCITDMYSPNKYHGHGEHTHPKYSGCMILGKTDGICEGKNEYNICKNDKKESININNLIKKLYPNVNIKVVALTAFMHWEFGKLNIPNGELDKKIEIYLNEFKDYCKICDLTPNVYLLKMCILIACADISAGSNKRLHLKNQEIPKQNYISKDPWEAFKMNERYLFYRKKVLEQFESSKSSFGSAIFSDYTYLKNLKI
jgi:hypothetical protein